MSLQKDIQQQLKDLNLYFYGVQLNAIDNGDIDKLASQLVSALNSGNPLQGDLAKIYPVALLANLSAIDKALQDLKAGTIDALDKQAILNAISLAKDNPAFLQEFIKSVDALRAEPTTD